MPVFLPEKFHEQRSLVDYSPWGHKDSDTTEEGANAGEVQAFPNGAGLKALQMFSRLQRQDGEAKRDWGGTTMSTHLSLLHSALKI